MKKTALLLILSMITCFGSYAQDSETQPQTNQASSSDTETVISIDDVIVIKGKAIDQLADLLMDMVEVVKSIDQEELEKTAIKVSGDLQKVAEDIASDPEIRKLVEKLEQTIEKNMNEIEKVDAIEEVEIEIVE